MSTDSVIAKVKRAWSAVWQKRIWGELAPWLYFAVTSLYFVLVTLFGGTSILWGLGLSFLCLIFFHVLYGRALRHGVSKWIVYCVSLGCFLLMGVVFSWLNIVPLLAGVLAIVMGVCVMVCAYSWLFRFRGGRIVGLLIVFALASVLYSKLKLTFNNYPYASEPVVEPFHIANQLVGVALPVRGQFNEGSVSTIKPLLYEGCHFFIWLFLISLAVSFANRELINRLYLKLTQFKPLYVFWSNNGSSEEETVAEDILRGKFFKPNVVLALWGKDKENAADVCDKWKRGRRWIEASSVEYDDIASYADAHYILSSDGNANLRKCMELMRHIQCGTIYVKTDGAADSYVDNFREYVRRRRDENAKWSIQIFSEVDLLKNEMSEMKRTWPPGNNNVFLVNYFADLNPSGHAAMELSRIELADTAGIAKHLGIPMGQIVGPLSQKLDHAGHVVFCCQVPRFQMMAIADYYKQRANARQRANADAEVYAYAKSGWLVELLRGCHGDLKIFGNEQSLFTQSRIATGADVLGE